MEAGDEVEAGDLLYVLGASEAEEEILDTEIELDADFLEEGMEVTIYYFIDASGTGAAEEIVLAPISALCTYDEGCYLLVAADKKPDNAIDPAKAGGNVTEYPDGYYAVPVEVGDYNGSYIQILSGVEADATLFLRYQNARPSGDYAGVALGSGLTRVSALKQLYDLEDISVGDFFLQKGRWYAVCDSTEYRISDSVEIHIAGVDAWLNGKTGLAGVLSDGYELTLYYDRAPSQGGMIRVIRAE